MIIFGLGYLKISKRIAGVITYECRMKYERVYSIIYLRRHGGGRTWTGYGRQPEDTMNRLAIEARQVVMLASVFNAT